MIRSLGHSGVIIAAATIGALAFWAYDSFRTPPGVVAMDGGNSNSETIAWISLAVAILSCLTALIGLIQKVIELQGTNRG